MPTKAKRKHQGKSNPDRQNEQQGQLSDLLSGSQLRGSLNHRVPAPLLIVSLGVV